jgi:4'-phosphopantetheinyl transferase EntD
MMFDTVNLPHNDFQLALRAIEDCQEPRYQSDLDAVINAVTSRQREYIAGRVLARELLGRLGVAAQTIASGPKREPLWPTGIVGSISHNELFCAVVVARDSAITSVGIDIETTGRIERQLWGHLFTEEETEHLLQLETVAQSRQATIFFSIKEAFYKYQFPLTQSWVGFRDVSVHQEDASFYRLTAQISDATLANNALAVVASVGTDQVIALVIDQSVLKATGGHQRRLAGAP